MGNKPNKSGDKKVVKTFLGKPIPEGWDYANNPNAKKAQENYLRQSEYVKKSNRTNSVVIDKQTGKKYYKGKYIGLTFGAKNRLRFSREAYIDQEKRKWDKKNQQPKPLTDGFTDKKLADWHEKANKRYKEFGPEFDKYNSYGYFQNEINKNRESYIKEKAESDKIKKTLAEVDAENKADKKIEKKEGVDNSDIDSSILEWDKENNITGNQPKKLDDVQYGLSDEEFEAETGVKIDTSFNIDSFFSNEEISSSTSGKKYKARSDEDVYQQGLKDVKRRGIAASIIPAASMAANSINNAFNKKAQMPDDIQADAPKMVTLNRPDIMGEAVRMSARRDAQMIRVIREGGDPAAIGAVIASNKELMMKFQEQQAKSDMAIIDNEARINSDLNKDFSARKDQMSKYNDTMHRIWNRSKAIESNAFATGMKSLGEDLVKIAIDTNEKTEAINALRDYAISTKSSVSNSEASAGAAQLVGDAVGTTTGKDKASQTVTK